MVRVRPATPADADDLVRVHVRTWQDAYAGIIPGDVLDSLDGQQEERRRQVRDRLSEAQPRFRTLVAVEPDSPDNPNDPNDPNDPVEPGAPGSPKLPEVPGTPRLAGHPDAWNIPDVPVGLDHPDPPAGDRPIGFATFGPYRLQQGRADGAVDPSVGEVLAIYVDPAHQGGGAGRALMGAAVAALRAAGAGDIRLWVLEENAPSLRFYARYGFVPDGERHLFHVIRPDGTTVDLPEVRLVLRGHD